MELQSFQDIHPSRGKGQCAHLWSELVGFGQVLQLHRLFFMISVGHVATLGNISRQTIRPILDPFGSQYPKIYGETSMTLQLIFELQNSPTHKKTHSAWAFSSFSLLRPVTYDIHSSIDQTNKDLAACKALKR